MVLLSRIFYVNLLYSKIDIFIGLRCWNVSLLYYHYSVIMAFIYFFIFFHYHLKPSNIKKIQNIRCDLRHSFVYDASIFGKKIKCIMHFKVFDLHDAFIVDAHENFLKQKNIRALPKLQKRKTSKSPNPSRPRSSFRPYPPSDAQGTGDSSCSTAPSLPVITSVPPPSHSVAT